MRAKNLGRKAKPLRVPEKWELLRNNTDHLGFHELQQVTPRLPISGATGTCMLGLWSQNSRLGILPLSLTKYDLG